jgi:hypothetical protein
MPPVPLAPPAPLEVELVPDADEELADEALVDDADEEPEA